MDEAALRHALCSAAQQLWMRGLIVADGGMLSAEVHRRRYLVSPPGKRRSDLREDDLRVCDIGGVQQGGGVALDENLWRAHRVAYLLGLGRTTGAPSNGSSVRQGAIAATIVATPPMLLALLRMTPGATELPLHDLPPVPVIQNVDDASLRNAVAKSSVVALGLGTGHCIFTAAADIWQAVNLLERYEHTAAIEMACRRHTP